MHEKNIFGCCRVFRDTHTELLCYCSSCMQHTATCNAKLLQTWYACMWQYVAPTPVLARATVWRCTCCSCCATHCCELTEDRADARWKVLVGVVAVQGAAGPCWHMGAAHGGSEPGAEQQLQHAGHACQCSNCNIMRERAPVMRKRRASREEPHLETRTRSELSRWTRRRAA